MTTVAEEGNRRTGGMTPAEVEQCAFDIKMWFTRSGMPSLSGASSSDIQKLEKSLDIRVPEDVKILLGEIDGDIYFFDKKFFSCLEMKEMVSNLDGSKKWRSSFLPICGDETAMLLIDTERHNSLYEWDSDDGIGDVESSSFGAYLERYRNMLLAGQCDFVKDVGVIEKMSAASSRKK